MKPAQAQRKLDADNAALVGRIKSLESEYAPRRLDKARIPRSSRHPPQAAEAAALGDLAAGAAGEDWVECVVRLLDGAGQPLPLGLNLGEGMRLIDVADGSACERCDSVFGCMGWVLEEGGGCGAWHS